MTSPIDQPAPQQDPIVLDHPLFGVFDPEVRALTAQIIAMVKSGELPSDLLDRVAQYLEATGASVLSPRPGGPEAEAEVEPWSAAIDTHTPSDHGEGRAA